jgi:hypothetical protein
MLRLPGTRLRIPRLLLGSPDVKRPGHPVKMGGGRSNRISPAEYQVLLFPNSVTKSYLPFRARACLSPVGRLVYPHPFVPIKATPGVAGTLYPLPKVLTELVVKLAGGGEPLNEDLTALRHSQ